MLTGSLYELLIVGARPSGTTASVDAWVDDLGHVFCDRCARGGPAMRVSPAWNVLVNLAADPERRVSPSLAAIYTTADEGRSLLWRVRPYVRLRPSTRVSLQAGARYQRNQDNTQWLAHLGTIGADTTHYLFGYLKQDLLSFTGRLDLTLRPAVSLQDVCGAIRDGRLVHVRA